jgi:outer membrane protein assembly factor BamB
VAYGKTYSNGGHIRIVRPTGMSGHSQPWDAVACDYRTNQVVQSSPSVGRFLANKGVGIVVGTGNHYAGASDSNAVFAITPGCGLAWRATLDGQSLASPSLIDTDRNGTLEVVTASTHGSTGSLYVLDGATGRTKWRANISHGPVYGQVTSIDINGRRSLLVGHPGGVTVYDAATGAVTGQLLQYIGVQNTPAVTVDPGNRIGVTVVGYNGSNAGVAYHFQLKGATATTVGAPGQWPMFHRDPQLRGAVTGTIPS